MDRELTNPERIQIRTARNPQEGQDRTPFVEPFLGPPVTLADADDLDLSGLQANSSRTKPSLFEPYHSVDRDERAAVFITGITSSPPSMIFLECDDHTAADSTVAAFFGPRIDRRTRKASGGYFWIEYTSVQQAEKVVACLNGRSIGKDADEVLTVKLHRDELAVRNITGWFWHDKTLASQPRRSV